MKTGKTFVPEPITFEEIQLVDEEPIRNQTDPIHQMLMDVPITSEEVVEEVVEEIEEAGELEYEEEPEDESEDDSEDDHEAEEEVEYERPAVWKECFNITNPIFLIVKIRCNWSKFRSKSKCPWYP